MKIYKLFFLLMLTCLITACITAKQITIPKGAEPISKEDTAYLVGTIAARTEGDDYTARGFYNLVFRAVGTSEPGYITYSQTDISQTPVVYKTENSEGGIFVAVLRPGDYEFYNINFFFSGGLASHTFKAKQDFSVPFKLKPGRVLYTGELLACGAWAKNALQYVPVGGYFIRTDQTKRDKPLIETAHPEIRGLPWDIIPIEKIAPPFLVPK